jgi:hypothetical protein
MISEEVYKKALHIVKLYESEQLLIHNVSSSVCECCGHEIFLSKPKCEWCGKSCLYEKQTYH